jgi:photosynthetic reaction center H subunit
VGTRATTPVIALCPNRTEDEMARDYETEDGVRIAPLGALRDLEVAEGYPDIRGWRVESVDGREVGKVHELLVDIDNMRTRYLEVRLAAPIAATPGDRDVLVPIGTAQIADGAEVVRVPLTAERVGLLPLYDHGRLTRTHELEVRRHFSLGEAAAAAVGAAGTAAAATPTRDFYDHEAYDDRRFFGPRRVRPADQAAADVAAARSDAEVRRDEEVRLDADARRDAEVRRDVAAQRDAEAARAAEVRRDADARRDIRMRDDEIRVPVERADSVVLKRGDDGRDEIIIRRPVTDREERSR